MELRERYRGALLGVAVGDALGTTLEFKRPPTFSPITDMVGGAPFHLKATQWTDDISMAVCLAESLIDGEQGIPEAWRSRLAYRELIERCAEQLCALARPT